MATESPIRILEGTDRWQSSRYGSSSARMAIEDLDLFLKDQRFQSLGKDVIPSRSESAPPSMEGSVAAIENIFSHNNSDKRLSGPHNYQIFQFSSGPHNSLQLPMNNLPAHEEECEDDRSSEQSLSLSVKKASISGSGSLDPKQEELYYASPSSYDPEGDLNSVKADKQDARIGALKNLNIYSSSNSCSHKFHKNEQFIPQNNAQGSIIYPGISHAYNNPNQVQPIYAASASGFMTSPNAFYPNLQPAGFFAPQYGIGGYNFSSTILPSYLTGYPHHVPLQPPFHMQYFQPPVRDSYSSYSHFNHQALKDGAVENQVNYKSQHFGGAHNNLNMKRGNMSSHYYFGSHRNDGGRYSNTSLSHSSSGNPSKANDMNPSYSFLEELKSGKGQRFDLSDIVGHIVEFSVDQHGSRFIQQKLEICSVEEKASVFKEVVPHAPKLMTDVFGNYVIQKLFEYGSPEQRKYLADQLEGQILPLSLQMYGCRVIQKALDVIDIEQKANLVRELDGHVIRCVRDQNGNHVIQKCIESIPTDDIHFIISSFRGHVATLSIHPYGCRVIQRVLEHCNDDIHTQFIVDEILGSVCTLAQDQYGNYVTQHVLERGNTHERSEIIEKLGGSIVQLSQHKFASNVIEKCLEYCDSNSRGMLIKEIIGDADKNDNLLIMMKDQYANYVIQKILEKCSIIERELLLGLIRNHVTALKKYTYGKHIVARFEQLYGDEIKTSGS